ncbi:hypothetical protein [Streptomyces boncukensis]|uniref:Uncharacterized protein n=1 Tax=Streptomyces boncukensis TaxID=2711219 RepID=A0A6G4WSQ6_9ACTN|nr:hypothetical protein [Streptomyces boncukensis]NGO67882.1 hypothetical protein [Streptomyces boncukensis]
MEATEDETPPPSMRCTAVCRTATCPNLGKPFDTVVYTDPTGDLALVICARCEAPITDLAQQEAEPST